MNFAKFFIVPPSERGQNTPADRPVFMRREVMKKTITEDVLAIWIGFIVIVVGAISVLTGAFNFNALNFSTWGNGTSLFAQINGGFFGKLILTYVVLALLFTVGAKFKGEDPKKFLIGI